MNFTEHELEKGDYLRDEAQDREWEREQLERTSTLIKACKLCGARFEKDHIVLADGLVLTVVHKGFMWKIDGWLVPTRMTTKHLQMEILNLHFRLLKNNLAEG